MVHRIKTIFLTAVVPFMAISCGTADPTETEAQAALEQAVMVQLNGTPFTVTDFGKTNGQASEINGVSNYVVFYTATVEYPEGYRTECLQENAGLQGFQVALGCSADFAFSDTPFRPDHPGGFVQLEGTIPFSLTENGWIAGQPQIGIVD